MNGTCLHLVDQEALKTLIPELRESEDESIRKKIIRIVKNETGWQQEFPSQDQCLAWLEKQKEQPTNEEMLRTLRAEYEKGVADTIAKYEQKEQKEIPLMNGDADMYFDDLRMTTKPLTSREWFNEGIKYAQRLQKEQKPEELATNRSQLAEWSEDIIQKAIKEVGLTQHQINWFKTNVFPPKREWSEEDKRRIADIFWAIKHCAYSDNKKSLVNKWFTDWLESLRSRPKSSDNWKPSEEQIRALQRAVNKLAKTDVADSVMLSIMYDNLKKLM